MPLAERLCTDETGFLPEAFDECDLPYRVDNVDWRTIGEGCRTTIEAGLTPLAEVAT